MVQDDTAAAIEIKSPLRGSPYSILAGAGAGTAILTDGVDTTALSAHNYMRVPFSGVPTNSASPCDVGQFAAGSPDSTSVY